MDLASIARGLRVGTAGLLWPFDQLGPFWGMTLVSILSGAVILWVIGKTTPQKLLGRAKDRMQSAVYEVRLYLDSPGRMFRAQGRLLRWGLTYVGLMLPSLLVASLPLGLLFVHYESRYALAPLPLGETTLARIALADGADGGAIVGVAGAGYEITAPPVWDEADRAVYLRLRGVASGRHALTVQTAAGQLHIPVVVAGPSGERVDDGAFIPAERRGDGELLFAYGHEPPLPDGPAESIRVTYPVAEQRWLGMDMPWWIYWLIVATLAAFALRGPMNVKI